MAGQSSIIAKKERANTVRPESELNDEFLNPMHDNHNEPNIEQDAETEDNGDSWEAMARKFEELETKMAEQFEDGGVNREAPPATKAPYRYRNRRNHGSNGVRSFPLRTPHLPDACVP